MSSRVAVQRYAAALDAYLSGEPEDVAPLHAYELGRDLMDAGLGLLDVVRLHNEAVARVEDDAGSHPGRRAKVGVFLAEVLAPFEMAYLGFQEANAALRRLTGTLEEAVDERTRELRQTLAELEAIDAERRRLLARVVAAQERERERIAEDLHDDVIQVMSAAALRIGTLHGHVAEEQVPLLDRLEKSVADATGRLRHLVFELRPPALDREGLAAAIRLYLRESAEEGLEATVEDRLDDEPPARTREVAYRVVQEALVNVRKHAAARHVVVTLDVEGDGLRAAVRDDGRGFDPRTLDVARPGHLGVSAMCERAALAGGTCTVDSAPGRGTTVTLWVPWHVAQPTDLPPR